MKLDIDFWLTGTQTTYEESWRELVDMGMDKKYAAMFLQDLYYAASEDFGGC